MARIHRRKRVSGGQMNYNWFRILMGLVIILGIWFWNSDSFWRNFYPINHQETIIKHATTQKIDPLLVAAVIRTESKFHSKATSRSGALGLMQIMPDTAKWIAQQRGDEEFHKELLFEPDVNIEYGTWYIANLSKEFDGDLVLVIAAYNAGRGNVNRWLAEKKWTGEHTTLEQIPFPETREYVKRVLKNYENYRELYPELSPKDSLVYYDKLL